MVRPDRPPSVGVGGSVTSINGTTFVICDPTGDLDGGHHGLVVRDTRHLAELVLRIDGQRVDARGVEQRTPTETTYSGASRAHEVTRHRRVVANGFDEEIDITARAADDAETRVTLAISADFVDVFALRQPGMEHSVPAPVRLGAAGLDIRARDIPRRTVIEVEPAPDVFRDGAMCWSADVPSPGSWRLRLRVRGTWAGAAVRPAAPAPTLVSSLTIASDPPALAEACAASADDLRWLAMTDPRDPARRLLAAGVPWYVALFGRDSLLATMQLGAFDATLMIDTLAALADRQGRWDDPGNEEEPGKILHEERLGDRPWLGSGTTGGIRPYFGSIDATPLFVIAVAEAWRWGAPPAAIESLLPAVQSAVAWIRRAEEARGGFIAHRTATGATLRNQGWKDSPDAIQFADGRLADGPLALVEVQAYAYRARRDAADMLEHFGLEDDAPALRAEAAALRARVRERFWIHGRHGAPGYFAVALDGAHEQVDAVTSNLGHLLWCGIPSDDEAAEIAAHLTSDAMSSGWGLRTLSTDSIGYDPAAYHLGSVWPHDTAIACAGLRRYGYDQEAAELAADLLDAAVATGGHLPELFRGDARNGAERPTSYLAACRPQAWAAAAPFAIVVTLLGLEPDIPAANIRLRPCLPGRIVRLRVGDITFPSGVLSVEVTHGRTAVDAAPPGLSTTVNSRRSRRNCGDFASIVCRPS